mmetsp:Transcript_125110/g.359222  ORF Transcript_125110/g.359222 Transcript_125110/m.359222 type:complete len:303 (+) Transcript_125110:42-950(+)
MSGMHDPAAANSRGAKHATDKFGSCLLRDLRGTDAATRGRARILRASLLSEPTRRQGAAANRSRVAELEVAPNLGVRLLHIALILVPCPAIVVAGLLLLGVLACELIPVPENPHPFAERLVVPEGPGVERPVWENPLADGDLPVLPVPDKLRAVLRVGVCATAVLLAGLPLAYVRVAVDVCECAVGRVLLLRLVRPATPQPAMEVAYVRAAARRLTSVVARLLLILSYRRPVDQLAEALLLVFLVLAIVSVPELFPCVHALTSSQALHVSALVSVPVLVTSPAEAGELLRSLLERPFLVFSE